MTDDENEIHS